MEHNIQAFYNLITYVGDLSNDLRMVRLGSDCLPVYTHPEYSYFWKLVNREKRGGVSIHYVTTELDEGELIARKTYRIRKKDTVIDLSYKSAKIGTKLLLKTLKKIKAKELTLQNHKKISTRAKHKCYGYPTRAAAKKLYQNGRNLISIKKLTKYL